MSYMAPENSSQPIGLLKSRRLSLKKVYPNPAEWKTWSVNRSAKTLPDLTGVRKEHA